VPLTTIQDVLYKADGAKFNGLLIISWNSFEADDMSNIVSQNLTVKVVDGNFRVRLVPTADSNPPSYYSVKYNSDGKIQFQETWVVGTASTPLRIRDVRASSSSTSPLQPPSQTPIQESDVVRLVGDLGLRPVKGPGFSAGRVAAINALGGMEAVFGNPSDCVFVDGTSGPCGGAGPVFTDGEVPGGRRGGWHERDIHARQHAESGRQPGALPQWNRAETRSRLHANRRDGAIPHRRDSAAG
jgi:hypothetical protein